MKSYNTSVIVYVKNKGCNIRKYNCLAKNIWNFCTKEDIFLPPVHIPGK